MAGEGEGGSEEKESIGGAMRKELLTEKRARELLDFYEIIQEATARYTEEFWAAFYLAIREKKPVEFHGHVLTAERTMEIVERLSYSPRDRSEFMCAGQPATIANMFIGHAENFLSNLPHASYMPHIPAIDERGKEGA